MPSGSGEVLEQGRDKISKGFQKEQVEEERQDQQRKKKIKIRKKKAKEDEEETGLNSRLEALGDMGFFSMCTFLSRKTVNGHGSHYIN